MAKRMGLGKGLGALIADTSGEPEKTAERAKPKSREKEETGKELYLKISSIEPNRMQPRKNFDEEQLKELADSIRQYGVLQPLLVQKNGDYYEIIAGERRWRAAKMAGLKEIPAVLREYDQQRRMEIALIENVQREDLNPIEEATAYQRLMDEFHLKQDEIAASVSKSRTAITNTMRLLKLDERVQKMVMDNLISSGHGRTIIPIEDKELQYETACKILDENLSVREAEQLVKKLLERKPDKEKKEEESQQNAEMFHYFEGRMKDILGSKVTIKNKKNNKGRIEIEYYSAEELERIIDLIQSIQ